MKSSPKIDANREDNVWDVAVIGGGPAGMMAAGRAAELGAKVILIEKNATLGKKLLITGGGRCNVTNAEFDNRKLLEKYKGYGKYLHSAFSQFRSKDSIDFFNKLGMMTKVEAENRVFPTSNSSKSVLDALIKYMKNGGVTIKINSPIVSLNRSMLNDRQNIILNIRLEDGTNIYAKSFIIATGGKAVPETGSTGDAFKWLKDLGHNIIKPDLSLVPVKISDKWVHELQGISLPEIKISIFQFDKKVETKKGKILFTHFGVSGPTILNMSKKISELLSYGDVEISLDLMPKHDFSTLNTALQELFKKHLNKKIKNVLPDLVPSALVDIILMKTKIDTEKSTNSITREERVALMKILKDLRMNVSGLLSLDNAIVSSGGLDISEIDQKSMRSIKYKNLYITGDTLNIDRPSGGFSLQLCWTTGYVAGTHAAEDSNK
jgi:predicted Rossmann fold flavoprotein